MPRASHGQRSAGAVGVVVCSPDESRLDEISDWLVRQRFSPLPVANPDAARLIRYAQLEVLILDLAFGDPALDLLRAGRTPDFPYVSVIAISSADPDLRRLDATDDQALWVDALLPEPLDFDDVRHRIVEILRDVHHRDDLVLRVGLLVVDPPRRRVAVGDKEIHLTQKEFALLRVLASDPLRVFSKAELAEEVWGGGYPERSRSVESHASRLRRKLDPANSRFIQSYWGVGWRLVNSLDDAGAGSSEGER